MTRRQFRVSKGRSSVPLRSCDPDSEAGKSAMAPVASSRSPLTGHGGSVIFSFLFKTFAKSASQGGPGDADIP